MNKGWRLTIRPGYEDEGLATFAKFIEPFFRREKFGPFSGPKERVQRMMPGHQRRQDLKDYSKMKDYEKVKSIVRTIFYKDKVRLPPKALSDLEPKLKMK